MPFKIAATALGTLRIPETGTVTRALADKQWWGEHLRPLLDEVESGLAIDIGAHVGWFTVYLAQQLGHVIAVEPNPTLFQMLTWNVQRRPGLEHRIQCWPIAAYDRVTTLTGPALNDQTDMGGWAFTPDAVGGPRVNAAPLDLYLPVTTPLSLIKCDAQGADLRALRGLATLISNARPLILFEWEEELARWHGDSWQDYLDFFSQLNYTVDRITPHFWDYVARPL